MSLVMHAVLAAYVATVLGAGQLPEPGGPPNGSFRMVEPSGGASAVDDGDAEEANPWSVGLISAGLSAGVLFVGTQAWWDGGFRPFSIRETGLLERDTYAGGSDKLGHLYSAYVSMHIVAPLYRRLGLGTTSATWMSAIFTTVLWNGFEFIDGFTEFGFEYGDVLTNTLGIMAGTVSLLYPEVDRVVGLRIGYVPTRDFLAKERTFLKFINDYSGMNFYLDVRGRGLLEAAGLEPGLARYLVFGLVYGTNNYSPVRRHELRQRTAGLHLGLSASEILRSLGGGDEGVNDIARVFDFFAPPFLGVALTKDLNGDSWYLNFGVSNRSQLAL